MAYLLILALFLTLLLSVSSSNNKSPFVSIPLLGGVRGHYLKSHENRQYAAFEGIPYALPPVGERRFQPPERISGWKKDIDATVLPKPCSQYDSHNPNNRLLLGEENCLYLNIYTPINSGNTSYPVIFWIHGGGFQYGSSDKVGAKFLIDKDLILVTFNYRVGPFGFLSTNDDVVPGNMGLKDQSMALHWVSENIKYFGGDPQKITLTGVSAGGASVHYHYLSPMSRGLFRNGISFSGSALARWAYAPDTSGSTKTLATALNCPTNSSIEMVECLKSIPANDIILATSKLLSGLYFSYVWFPPVSEKLGNDGYFISDSPKNIMESGKVFDVPWISGVVSEEGLYITAGWALNETMMAYTEKNWVSIAPYMLHYQYSVPAENHTRLALLSKKHYLKNKILTPNRDTVRELTHLAGDDQIIVSSVRAAKLQASVTKSSVRLYYYSYRAAQSRSDPLSNTSENLGVAHGDDCYLVLNNTVINPTTTQNDKLMLQDMLRFWKSYAYDGEPDLKTNWPKIKIFSENFQFMHISGPGNFSIQTNNDMGEINFWTSIGL